MAIKDIRSNLEQVVAFNAVIASDTTTAGTIIDTADYDLGFMLAFAVPVYTLGTLTFTLEHGDDSALSDAATVPTANTIGTLTDVSLTAATAQADTAIDTLGFFGLKRYFRVNCVSADSADATVTVIATKKAELLPVV